MIARRIRATRKSTVHSMTACSTTGSMTVMAILRQQLPGKLDKISVLMAFRFEFDPVNKILLARFEGQLTNEAAAEYHDALGKNWRATKACAGIWDLSGVTDFAVAADFLRSLAMRKPISPGLTDHPRFIVVPETAGYGLMRMFQIAGESTRPLLQVVRTVDEALTALGAQSPHFEPLE
jgi:hypothetical protein